jgi:hypothetical protein
MDMLPPELFIFAIIAFLLGALSAWLIGYVSRGGKGKDRQQPGPTAEPEGYGSTDGQELLRVLRAKGGLLNVYVQGQRCRQLREITDPQVGRETVEALKAVMAFAEGHLPSIRQQAAQAAQPAPTASTTDQEAFLQQLRQPPPSFSSGPLTPPGKPKVRTPGNMLDPLTFIDDIDELVQQKLEHRPDLAGRFIRLTTGMGGGLRVYVDQQIFEAVGDISDPEVRALIQEAIREWESEN